MSAAASLTIRVHLADARYHGEADWPPAPARLFQALVAASAVGDELPVDAVKALEWLEGLPAPLIRAPNQRLGQRVRVFVPNNDLDTGKSVEELRVAKSIQPRLLDGQELIYAWSLVDEDDAPLDALRQAVERLSQLGRGVDMAWARLDLHGDPPETAIGAGTGVLHRPGGEGRETLLCPGPGSLASLRARHAAAASRFATVGVGRQAQQTFRQPPKPRFVSVAYDTPPRRCCFELRAADDAGKFVAIRQESAVALVEAIRDAAARRLDQAGVPGAGQWLIGKAAEGERTDPARRVRLIPLASIGHEHVDRAIRRLLVEVPATCPITAEDLVWALGGLPAALPGGPDIMLLPAQGEDMLAHYGVGSKAVVWSSVTPLALPAPRRRLERGERKDAVERLAEEDAATSAVRQALRHARVEGQVVDVVVQREPFAAHGRRAEDYSPGTRFPKERLWHVRLTLAAPAKGPLVVGDGRFLGLGVMAPDRARDAARPLVFRILDGLSGDADPLVIARAMRRAVMSRVQAELGPRAELPPLVSGHDGAGPVRGDHLAYGFDPVGPAINVFPSSARDGTLRPTRDWELVVDAVSSLTELRAGAAGVLRVLVDTTCESRLFGASRSWRSLSPYFVDRHEKRLPAEEALAKDVERACTRRGLPVPQVEVYSVQQGRGGGLAGVVTLHFPVSVAGPVFLGRTRFKGGGIFVPT